MKMNNLLGSKTANHFKLKNLKRRNIFIQKKDSFRFCEFFSAVRFRREPQNLKICTPVRQNTPQ